MISIKPIFDGSNTFVYECTTKDELQFVKENGIKILDKFIEIRFNNIGKLSIKTFSDYKNFCEADPATILETYSGHRITHLSDIDELDVKNAFIISDQACKNLKFTQETHDALAKLANEMFLERAIKKPTGKDA